MNKIDKKWDMIASPLTLASMAIVGVGMSLADMPDLLIVAAMIFLVVFLDKMDRSQ